VLIDVMNITELDVEALIDSELSWEREKQVRLELARNPRLYEYYQGLVRQKRLLISWWHFAYCENKGEQ
jgi:hypothetical protein